MGEQPFGHREAAERLRDARGSIYQAFDSLGIFDHKDALAYLAGSPGYQALPEEQRGRVAGLCMGFALTVVEAERSRVLGLDAESTGGKDG